MKASGNILVVLALAVLFILPVAVSAQIVQSGNIILDLSEVQKGVNPPVNPALDMEMLLNGGFETGTFTPWYHDGAWTISTNGPHTGTYCAYDVDNHWVRQDIAPTPWNEIASVTLWMRQPEAQISAIDFFYSNLPYSEDVIWVTASWAQYDVTSFIEPGGIVTGIRIYGYWGGPPQLDETFLDDVSFQTYGMPEVTISMTPAVFPIYLPPEGGSFDYTVEIANIGTGTAIFDGWTEAFFFMPDTAYFGPLILRTVTLGVGGSIEREMSQYVPQVAPDGSYYLIGKVGDYPATVVDADSFQFNKGIYVEGGNNEPVTGWECFGWEEQTTQAGLTPQNFSLQAVYPNPFNNETTIAYSLASEGFVTLSVYDINGRLVEEIVNGWHPSGAFQAKWNAGEAASGVYFFRLTSAKGAMTQKGILLK